MKRNPKLLLFPLLTSFFSVIVLLFFVAPTLLLPTGHAWNESAHWEALGKHFLYSTPAPQGEEWHLKTSGYLCVAGIYLVSMFLMTFCNAAFYNEILKALEGKSVSLRSGFAFAVRRIWPIFVWSLFAGAVGLVIQTLEEKFGWIGALVMRLVGMVWSVASVFAIPVLLREDGANPVRILRSSAATIKKTWGESLIGYVGMQVGMQMLFLLIPFSGIALFIALFVAGVEIPVSAIIAFAVGYVFLLIILGYLLNVAEQVYRCALYIYATENIAPADYTPEMLNGAWKTKRAKA